MGRERALDLAAALEVAGECGALGDQATEVDDLADAAPASARSASRSEKRSQRRASSQARSSSGRSGAGLRWERVSAITSCPARKSAKVSAWPTNPLAPAMAMRTSP